MKKPKSEFVWLSSVLAAARKRGMRVKLTKLTPSLKRALTGKCIYCGLPLKCQKCGINLRRDLVGAIKLSSNER